MANQKNVSLGIDIVDTNSTRKPTVKFSEDLSCLIVTFPIATTDPAATGEQVEIIEDFRSFDLEKKDYCSGEFHAVIYGIGKRDAAFLQINAALYAKPPEGGGIQAVSSEIL